MELFDYEKLVIDTLEKHEGSSPKDKHLWILKATCLGITELFIRFIAWLCLKDDKLNNSQICIVMAPRLELAITLIDRLKGLFLYAHNIVFDTKETVIELNGVHIEAFPSNHLDDMRGLVNVKLILLDESDFWSPQSQKDARGVSERYIGKSDPYIVMVSTPNAPGGLFETIEREPDDKCLYRRLRLDYRYGLGKIYTEQETERAKASPSFEREYDLKYLGLVGNLFSELSIQKAVKAGKGYNPVLWDPHTPKYLGVDPGFGSSNFGICLSELHYNGNVHILLAEEHERPDFNEMVNRVLGIIKYANNIERVHVDAANPEFVKALKLQLGERLDYLEERKEIEANNLSYNDFGPLVEAVPFAKEGREMLGHVKRLVEMDQPAVQINPRFDRLTIALRTAVAFDSVLDKHSTKYNDLLDSFRLSLKGYQVLRR